MQRLEGGELAAQPGARELEDSLRLRQIPQQVLAQVTQRHLQRQTRRCTSSTVVNDSNTWPPWPADRMRETRLSVIPETYSPDLNSPSRPRQHRCEEPSARSGSRRHPSVRCEARAGPPAQRPSRPARPRTPRNNHRRSPERDSRRAARCWPSASHDAAKGSPPSHRGRAAIAWYCPRCQ